LVDRAPEQSLVPSLPLRPARVSLGGPAFQLASHEVALAFGCSFHVASWRLDLTRPPRTKIDLGRLPAQRLWPISGLNLHFGAFPKAAGRTTRGLAAADRPPGLRPPRAG